MKVVVTRPEPDAAPWVQALRERDHDVLPLPLMVIAGPRHIQPLQQAWQHLGDYHAVMFVSGNAVRHFFAAAPSHTSTSMALWPTTIRAWATGPGTRRALLAQKLSPSQVDAPDATVGQFDSEALWLQVGSGVAPGQRVLIVRGTDETAPDAANSAGVGRDWLTRQLIHSGAQVDTVVSYQRQPPRWNPHQQAQARQAATDGSVWLLSSSEAVGHLVQALPQQSWHSALALATHPRIAQAATQAGFGVVWESRPALAEVIASIESKV